MATCGHAGLAWNRYGECHHCSARREGRYVPTKSGDGFTSPAKREEEQ